MALIMCHECGKKISTDAKQCPHCGTIEIKPKTFNLKSKFLTKFWMFTMFILFPILSIIILWKGKVDIFSLFGAWILFAFVLLMGLSLIELIAEVIYHIFTNKELFPDEKKADD